MSVIDQEIQHEIARVAHMSDGELAKAIDDYGQHPAVRVHQALLVEAGRRQNAVDLG